MNGGAYRSLISHLTVAFLFFVAQMGHYSNFKQSDYDNMLQQLKACCKHIIAV